MRRHINQLWQFVMIERVCSTHLLCWSRKIEGKEEQRLGDKVRLKSGGSRYIGQCVTLSWSTNIASEHNFRAAQSLVSLFSEQGLFVIGDRYTQAMRPIS